MDELWSLLDQMTPAQVAELKDTLAASDNPEIVDVLASVAAWEFARNAAI